MASSTASSWLEAVAVAQLDGGAGVAPARTGGLEVGLLVVAAGDVVGEDPPGPPAQVVAGEQRHHRQALHGQWQVGADHLGELVGLALEAEGHALDLLVVLELDLEEPDHLDGEAGRPGDGHRRVAVGGEDLLHGPVGDGVALGGPAVAGHDDPVGEAQRHHRGGVAHAQLGVAARGSRARAGRCAAAGRRSRVRGPRSAGRAGRVTRPTARPSGRSCGRTPRRCPRGPRRSRRAGRRGRPSASRRAAEAAGASSTSSSAFRCALALLFSFCHVPSSTCPAIRPPVLPSRAQPLQQLRRGGALARAGPRCARPFPSAGPS